jgi:hypothetical protein
MSNKKEYIPIFVGSTYSDLIEYRKAVMDSLHKLKTVVNGMEYFGSKPGSPIEECLNAVRDSKIYIGIFAMRYGSIEDNYDKSYTHLEYLEAQKLKLPSLIYIIDEDRQPILTKNIEIGENAERLLRLKAELKKKFMVSFFTTPDDLATKIAQDLPPVLVSIGVTVKEENLETQNIEEIIKKFENRPKKYAGSEIVISGELLDEPTKPDSDTVEALRLTLGDTLKNRIKTSFSSWGIYIYAERNLADELEKYKKGDIVTVKLKFLFGEEKETQWTDEGQILKKDIKTGYEILEIRTGANKVLAKAGLKE